MRTRAKAGLCIIAGGLFFVGAATATDLIVNGSFETVTGGAPEYGGIKDGTETGWNGIVSSLPYSPAYFDGPPVPLSENRGAFHSWRHQSAVDAYSTFSTPTTDLSYVPTYALKQTVNLTNALSGA